MSAIYMSQLSTALPLMEGDHHHQDHHHQGHFQAFTMPKDPPLLFPFMIGNNSTSSDSSNGLISYGSTTDHHHHHLMRQQQQAMLIETHQHMIGGSAAAAASVFTTPFPTVQSIRDDMIEPSSYDPYDMGKLSVVVGGSVEASGNWAPPAAKMRITRKASADPGAVKKPRKRAQQAYEDLRSQPNLGVIRVCSDCNTTKTPLWRSGPCGPKSLCNACGIRQRKARRAMMAASADGVKAATPAVAMHSKAKKEKRSAADVDRSSLPFKKRCKVVLQDHAAVVGAAPLAAAADSKTGGGVQQQATAAEAAADDAGLRKELVDNVGLISWSRPSPAPAPTTAPDTAASCSSFRSSPSTLPVQHDEITDAAMLLMTLSCGLVRS